MRATEAVRRKKAMIYALAQSYAGKMEGEAKRNAPWTDRTSHARQALKGGVEQQGSKITLYLAHGKRYGTYLEQGTGLHGPFKQRYTIKPKNKKALFWAGAAHPVKSVNHPGMRPRAIIKPTFEKNLPKIKKDVRRLLSGGVR